MGLTLFRPPKRSLNFRRGLFWRSVPLKSTLVEGSATAFFRQSLRRSETGSGTDFRFWVPHSFRPELGRGPRKLDRLLPRDRSTGTDTRARTGVKIGNGSLTPLPPLPPCPCCHKPMRLLHAVAPNHRQRGPPAGAPVPQAP